MLKKKFVFLLVSVIMITSLSRLSYSEENKTDKLNLSAKTAILIDAETGEALYEKEPSKTMFPASTTKILTAIIAIENSKLDDKVIIDEEVAKSKEGTHLGLVTGEVFSMKDLLHGLLISSNNDVAVAIAKHISGDVENFSILMNSEAKRMGAKDSNFVNPSGLPDENHISSAYDLAVIARYAMGNDTFKDIVKKSTYEIEPTNKTDQVRKLKNSNKLLFSDDKIKVDGKDTSVKYQGVDGIKTGYTKADQQCMVSSLNRDGKRYISVTLHSIGTNIYADAHKLFNYSSKDAKPTILARKNEFVDNISIEGGDSSFITAVFASDFKLDQTNIDLSHITREFKPTSNLKLPISKGQLVGKVTFKDEDKVIGSANIISNSKIIASDTRIEDTIDYITDKWWFWLIVSLIILRILVGLRRVNHRAKMLRLRKKQVKRNKKLRRQRK